MSIYMNVYADNASTTKLSKAALREMLPYMDSIYANASSSHTFGQKAKCALKDARIVIGNCIGVRDSTEIIFTSGGTESDNQAIISAAFIGKSKGKNHILTSIFEHHAVLNTMKILEKQGFEVSYIGVDSDGIINLDELKDKINERTCLISIMYVNNEIGTVQPVEEIGKICRQFKDIIFHTDAVQAIGHLPIDVQKFNIDMLSASGHKFHGPKGCGFLYIRKGIQITNYLNGGLQEFGLRPGTENIPGIVGMATALNEATTRLIEDSDKIYEMSRYLINGINHIPHSIINGHLQKRVPGIVNLCFEGVEGEKLVNCLDAKGILVSAGSACTAGSFTPSHVLTSIGRSERLAFSAIRISLSRYNTKEEIDYLISVLSNEIELIRERSITWKRLKKGKINFES